ncbi:MAG: PDZ domain-containing protein [Flavobacteriaceae bacterium]|nr:PDZ domain-containing protein [Flavobacteriaceae bacterium]
MPPYQELLQEYGVEFTKIEDVGVGARLQNNKLVTNPKINSTAYHAGLQKEDKILSLNGELLSNNNLADKIKEMPVGDEVTLVYERNNIQNEKKIRLYPETSFKIVLMNEDSISTEQKKRLQDWLGPK